MNDLMRNLLNIGLIVGLSDRDSFVKNVSGILEEYEDDPGRREKAAKAIVDYLEQVKDNINTRNSIKGAVSDAGLADNKNVAELTKAVQELTAELRNIKHKP